MCFVRTAFPTECRALLEQLFLPIFFPDKDYLILNIKTHIRTPGSETLGQRRSMKVLSWKKFTITCYFIIEETKPLNLAGEDLGLFEIIMAIL